MEQRIYKTVEKALQAESRLVLYRDILNDPLVEKFLFLMRQIIRPETDSEEVISAYCQFTAAFLPAAAKILTQGKYAWQNYIINLILAGDNLFTRQAQVDEPSGMSLGLKKMAQNDLRYLQGLAVIGEELIKEAITQKRGAALNYDELPSWEGLCQNRDEKNNDEAGARLFASFHGLQEWGEGLEVLCDYYRLNGAGIFGRYHAFRWVRQNGEGKLDGVQNLDTVSLNQLYEYEREQSKIVNNTEQFLAGYPANNVLLYGDRGTGKSSTVKALVNMYGSRGLRLVEVRKQDLADFPLIVAELAGWPQKFILFVDDLSFDEQEGQYRELKALLEGGLEARPRNVLVYATSNRRHLVRENFTDRRISGFDPENEDVRAMDTLQEKLSLADRFGITVTFISPDQKTYLAIVEKMAAERGIDIPKEELQQRALKWEMSFNARSARTARQFVDYLEGQLALENHD